MAENATGEPISQASGRMLQVAISCPPEQTGYLEALLWTLSGVESVSELYSPDADSDVTRPEDLSAVTVLLRRPDGHEAVQALLNRHAEFPCKILDSRWIEEDDWAESWKQYWEPARVSDRLVICPTWEKGAYQPPEGVAHVIWLDPGRAFGTGTHPTTRLMLQGMEQLSAEKDFSQLSVLDVGTGSGILAIYAAQLGSHSITAIDNDPLAVASTQENIDRNGMADRVTAGQTPLGELCLTPYDLILANIIAPVILELMPDMIQRLNPDGWLLASGLIEKTVGDVEAGMRAHGLSVLKREQLGDWFAVLGRKA